MDPTAALQNLLDAIADYANPLNVDEQLIGRDEIIDRLDSLKDWVRRGGFMPDLTRVRLPTAK